MRLWQVVVVVVGGLTLCTSRRARAAMPTGTGRAPQSATAAQDPPASGSPTLLAQIFGERMRVVPLDPGHSFVEGYQDYQRHDLLGAIEHLKFAARAFPNLGDYALYYLGLAQRDDNQLEPAAATFRQLYVNYPRSVMAENAALQYAELELKLGHPDLAIGAAGRLTATATSAIDQQARLVVARAMYARSNFHAAYDEAQALRERYPAGAADAGARQLAHTILASHPEVANTALLTYRRSEAELLLREGQLPAALSLVRKALAASPPSAARPDLVWIEAAASRANPQAAKQAWLEYLILAPAGHHAPAALDALAHIYWHVDDTANARKYFERLVHGFPQSGRAPYAMFEIGRTDEDDGNLNAARSAYQNLARRYPASDSADDARFRAPFMLYMMKRYAEASSEFAALRERAEAGSERDMYTYWEARALEHKGDATRADELLGRVAASIDSNYYPALASLRTHVMPAAFPAADSPDLAAGPPPAVIGPDKFHMTRVIALRQLGLRKLEPAELLKLEADVGQNPALRDFILAEFQTAGAWYEALMAATRMAGHGEINHSVAERIRYPRAYWKLVSHAASRTGLDPYLVLALMRQESLFDPDARSVSDARGLMQLLPSTANRFASVAAMTASPLNLYDPNVSVELGTAYLKKLFALFADDRIKVVAAYNAGEHAVAGWIAEHPGDDDQWVENIGYSETRNYVKKVIGGLREYQLLYQHTYKASSAITPPPS